MRSLSTGLKQAANAAQTSEAFLQLVTIDHSSLAEPIRVTTDPFETLSSGVKGVISNTVEYVALPFEITLPDENEDQLPRAKLTIDNVSREVIAAVRGINTPATVNIKIVLASNPDVVEAEITNFELRNVTADALTVQGDLTTVQFDGEPYPAGRFTTSSFPSLL